MKNFILRDWEQTDAASIAIAANNEKIAANLRNSFPCPYTLADARWYVNDCIEHKNDRQITKAIVVEEKAVGSIGVFVKDDVYEKSAELGYWLAEDCWGQGIMTEAVKLICEEAFERLDIVRIFAEPFEHNMSSRRVLEKAGFTCEGIMRNGVSKNGRVFSYCMYSLLKDDDTIAFRPMRRFAQQLSHAEAEKTLADCTSGVLSVLGDGGYPYGVPLSYVYENGKIYFHCAKSGHKLDAMKNSDKASFCVIAQDEIVPEKYTTIFRSVIAFGRIREITDDVEMRRTIELLARRYNPADSAENMNAEIDREFSRLCMLEFTVEHMTGKEAIEIVRMRKNGNACD